MKIAIISDSHDNLANLEKAFSFIKKEKIETVIHCGDICSSSTLEEILNNFSGKFYLALGNADGDYLKNLNLQEFSNAKIWAHRHSDCVGMPALQKFQSKIEISVQQNIGKIAAENKGIAFCHLPEIARELAQSQEYDFVFYGHTHKPWEEKIGRTKMINPGNIAGLYYRPTFAVLEPKTQKLDLQILP